MGGCAGKLKSSDDAQPEPLPSEATISRDLAETETVAQENKEGGEKTENEAPLVDVSEPKQEGENTSSEPKAAVAEAKAEAETTATPSEEKVEAPVVVATKEPEGEAKPSDAAPTKVEDNQAPLVTV